MMFRPDAIREFPAGAGARQRYLSDPDVDVFSSARVIEVHDARNVQGDAFPFRRPVTRRRLWPDDAEHGEHPRELAHRCVEHDGHLHGAAAEVVIAKVDSALRATPAAVEG